MKKHMAMVGLVLLGGVASGQGLLGTKASVFESAFCKKWGCVFEGKHTDASGIESYEYTLKTNPNLFPSGWNTYGTQGAFKVFRQDGYIVSALILMGSQDSNLANYGKHGPTAAFIDLMKLLTGREFEPQNVVAIEGMCQNAHIDGKPKPVTRTLSDSIKLICGAELFCSSNGYGGGWSWDMWLKLR